MQYFLQNTEQCGHQSKIVYNNTGRQIENNRKGSGVGKCNFYSPVARTVSNVRKVCTGQWKGEGSNISSVREKIIEEENKHFNITSPTQIIYHTTFLKNFQKPALKLLRIKKNMRG